MLARAWNGDDLGDLDLHLIDLTGLLNTTTQMHLAYPVLYYFHSPYRDFALAPSVIVLDEAFTLIAHRLTRRPGLADTAWHPARAAVDQLLTVVGESVVVPHADAPPPPVLDQLRERGLPMREPEAFEAAVDELDGRRRLLRGFLAFEGRQWPPDAELQADKQADDRAATSCRRR